MTTVFLPPNVAEHVADRPELNGAGRTSSTTIIGMLDPVLEDPIAEADQSITVASAPPDVAQQLSCAADSPLLRIDRVYFDTRGRAVELGISHFLPENYSYRVRLQRSGR
jgi:DNA-binding GntR family transcriptional regulator